MTDTAGPGDFAADDPVEPESGAGNRFRLLGPMEVVCGGVVREVPSGRQQALLAALLLRPGEVVPAPMLMEQVWDASADRTVLNMCVMRLRRSLRDHDLICSEGNGYRIAVAAETVDLHRFRRLRERAGEHRDAGDRDRERGLLRQALGLWRGEALAGIVAPMLHSEIVPILEEERLAAIESRIDADLACGSHAEVIGELRQLVSDHPLRERLWCQLLLALYRGGRQSDALAAYLEARRRLIEDLGVEPGEELRDLHHRILTASPDLLAPPPVQTPVARIVPAQLPATVAGFSGRTNQLRKLDRLLERPDPAPVTVIMGPPGVGKTTLAVRWSSGHREHWPDGQLYIDLRGYGPEAAVRPIEALAYFLRALGLPPERVPGDVMEASALFRSLIADRRMLLLLDNAATVEQVRPLLPGGGCPVIVTSRDRLSGLVVNEGARQLSLEVMTDAEARTLLSQAVGDPRSAAEPHIVEELAELCGNLPLALRITAADLINHPERSLAEHAKRLRAGDRLDALQLAEEDGTAVRPAFESSYTRLPEPVRRLFRLLGLCPGTDVGADTVAVVAGIDSVTAGGWLDRLIAGHLVIRRGPDRFALHDLLRLFAVELAHEDETTAERDAARQRLYDHYVHTVEAAVERLYSYTPRLQPVSQPVREPVTFASDSAALAWLEAERRNLVAAVRHAADNGDHLDACRLGAPVHLYLKTKMYVVDMLDVARVRLAAARAINHLRALVSAHVDLAGVHRGHSQMRAAVRHLEQAIVLSRQDGWLEGSTMAHNNLAAVRAYEGRLDLSADHLHRALEYSRRTTGDVTSEAMILGNLSTVLLHLGQATNAVAHLDRASCLHDRLGSRASAARCQSNLGDALTELGDLGNAQTVLEQAAARQQELDDRNSLPRTLARLARVHLAKGEYGRAGELASNALELARDTGNRRAGLDPVLILAGLDEAYGRYDDAFERYREVRRTARDLGDRARQVEALVALGGSCRALGRRGQARHHLDTAVAMARRFGMRLWEQRAVAARTALDADDNPPWHCGL